MTKQTLDVIDLADHVNDAHAACFGVIRALDLMQREDGEDAALAGVLVKSLDSVFDTLDEVRDYLATQAE